MKYLLVFAVIFITIGASAQRASLKNDTLTYADRHFVVDDTINVAYGSGTNGTFVFVSMGSGLGGVQPLESSNSKLVTQIEKIYKSSGRLLIRCKILEGITKSPLGGQKIFIEPEGAIDKKEIN